jgi:hypothetical protein
MSLTGRLSESAACGEFRCQLKAVTNLSTTKATTIHREITELSQGYPPASFGYFTSRNVIA